MRKYLKYCISHGLVALVASTLSVYFLYSSDSKYSNSAEISGADLTNRSLKNESLTIALLESDIDLRSDKTSLPKPLINTVISLASENIVTEGLQRFLGYEDVDLQRINDVKGFSKSILSELIRPESDVISHGVQLIRFSRSLEKPLEDLNQNPLFAGFDGKIFGNFSAYEYGSPHVLVKWSNVNTNKILYFEKQLISPYSEENHVWMSDTNWGRGQFRVDVFEENDQLTPLASGIFNVY